MLVFAGIHFSAGDAQSSDVINGNDNGAINGSFLNTEVIATNLGYITLIDLIFESNYMEEEPSNSSHKYIIQDRCSNNNRIASSDCPDGLLCVDKGDDGPMGCCPGDCRINSDPEYQ